MLSIWKAVLLGVIQGATEFLPISSSGHLVVAQRLLGWTPENELILAFDIALHVGTLISVAAVFRQDIAAVLTGRDWRLTGYLVLATIPAVIAGFVFKDRIEGLFASVVTVGFAWLVTGLVLVLTRFVKAKVSDCADVGWFRSFIIGCAQAVAIIPGISRSGSTIAVGLFLKLNRKDASRFAFMMSIPAIAGGAILDAKNLVSFPGELIFQLIAGFIASAATGYLCIKWLLRIISRGCLWYFGVYCLIIGGATLIYLAVP